MRIRVYVSGTIPDDGKVYLGGDPKRQVAVEFDKKSGEHHIEFWDSPCPPKDFRGAGLRIKRISIQQQIAGLPELTVIDSGDYDRKGSSGKTIATGSAIFDYRTEGGFTTDPVVITPHCDISVQARSLSAAIRLFKDIMNGQAEDAVVRSRGSLTPELVRQLMGASDSELSYDANQY